MLFLQHTYYYASTICIVWFIANILYIQHHMYQNKTKQLLVNSIYYNYYSYDVIVFFKTTYIINKIKLKFMVYYM